MQTLSTKDILIRLPSDVVNDFPSEVIKKMILDKALTMAEYYHSRCKEFERKYGLDFDDFKANIQNSKDELFNEWDDMLVWEGFETAYSEWDRKLKALTSCLEY